MNPFCLIACTFLAVIVGFHNLFLIPCLMVFIFCVDELCLAIKKAKSQNDPK